MPMMMVMNTVRKSKAAILTQRTDQTSPVWLQAATALPEWLESGRCGVTSGACSEFWKAKHNQVGRGGEAGRLYIVPILAAVLTGESRQTDPYQTHFLLVRITARTTVGELLRAVVVGAKNMFRIVADLAQEEAAMGTRTRCYNHFWFTGKSG